MAASTEKRLLVLLLDMSKYYELSKSSEDVSQILNFQQCVDHVITFLNSYLLTRQSNSVSVILCHQIGSKIVYPVVDQSSLDVSELSSGKYEPIAQMNGLLKQEIKRVLSSIAEDPPKMVPSSTMLSSGLSISLCYIQRCLRETSAGETLKPRILIIRADQDIALQHRAIMNCIFAAQKQNIPIDSCVLWMESSYMQQASDLTGGTYIKIPEPAGLLQFLLWIFLPDVQTRSLLNLPSSALVDYRASCFCHNTLIDIGFVCSVCLAVFCNFVPICPVCQSHFKLPSLPSLKSKKKGKSSSKQKNK